MSKKIEEMSNKLDKRNAEKGDLMGLEITFRRTDLFTTIMMYGMTAAGVGLILKGLYGKSRK